MNVVWVFLGGGLGSVARYGVGRIVAQWTDTNFPLGTFLSNTFACVLLALVVYLIPLKPENTWLQPLVVIGFCGGFSTFSTFSNETVQLLANGNWGVALLNVLVSVAVGFGVIMMVRAKTGF